MDLNESGFLKTGTDNQYLDGGSKAAKNGHVGKRSKRRKNRQRYDVADTQEKVPLKNEMGHHVHISNCVLFCPENSKPTPFQKKCAYIGFPRGIEARSN